jgi:MauM/NapG family ferredoxin protein
MSASTVRFLRRFRIVLLTLSFACFVASFLLLRRPGTPFWLSRGIFFALDPLVLLEHLAANKTILRYTLWSLIPLVLTFVLGRFFCGWICPVGAIHEFISWIFLKPPQTGSGTDRPRFRCKYFVLTFVIVAALTGTTLAGWLDPFSLLTRSSASSLSPMVTTVLSRFRITPRASAQPVLLGSILLVIIGLNAWRRRFFCNSLCPLGALYGLASRFSFLRLETNGDCLQCGMCDSRCFYNGGGMDYIRSECVTCLACVEDCPTQSVQVKFAWPSRTSTSGLDLERRWLLGSAAIGLALAAFPKAALETHPRTRAGHKFLRPPGAVREDLFLSRCVRCGECVESCPTSFIQPARLEAGLEGIWTPVLDAQAGYCEYDCNRCGNACPTESLARLDLPQKKAFKVGTAVIDKNRCFTYSDGFNCTVCVEKCPVPSKPLRFRPVELQDFRGKHVMIHQVYVVADLCTGCAICQHFCPRGGAPGITITAEDEDRQAVTNPA